LIQKFWRKSNLFTVGLLKNSIFYYRRQRRNFNKDRNLELKKKGLTFSKRRIRKRSLVHNLNIATILIVVPSVYSKPKFWQHTQGNIFYEIYQSCVESYPSSKVLLFFVKNTSSEWKSDLQAHIIENSPDYIFMDAEIDPDGSKQWTIDQFLIQLEPIWSGLFIWLSIDSVLTTHSMRLDRLSLLSKKSLIVTIDRVPKYKFRGSSRIIAPIFLPISEETIADFDSKITGASPRINTITFFGTIYGYRERMLQDLQNFDLKIEVNPHKISLAKPSYFEYLQQLTKHNFTLNFSRNSRHNLPQLKSRILESAIFGCYVITDEDDLWRAFFPPGFGIFSFSANAEIKKICGKIERLNLDREYRNRYVQHARNHVNKQFWISIGKALIN